LEIRITGFGGQGVVLAGYIVGRACAIHAGKHATMVQSFGPEARGSACSSTLVVSGSEVLYPYVRRPDILVAMSAEGYEKYSDELKDDGILIYEKDLVTPAPKPGQTVRAVPSTRIAESLGKSIVQNIVMIGFLAAVARIVPREAMVEAVQGSVPAETEAINLEAFAAGWDYYETEYGSKQPPAGREAVAAAPGQSAEAKAATATAKRS
jgi:2-oxoglutarate ferredoxin oxidoreductase subunit gamma